MADGQSPADLQRARAEREKREREQRPEHPLPGEDPEDGAEDEIVAQITITGDEELSHAIGGKKPTESVVVFRGGEIAIVGPNGRPQQFRKGSRIAFLIEGPIREIAEIDKSDGKTGEVTGTKKKHTLKPDTLRRIPAGMVETLQFDAEDLHKAS